MKISVGIVEDHDEFRKSLYDLAIFFSHCFPTTAFCCYRQIKREQPSNTLITLCKTVFKLLFEHAAHGSNKTKNCNKDAGEPPTTVLGLYRSLLKDLIASDCSGKSRQKSGSSG